MKNVAKLLILIFATALVFASLPHLLEQDFADQLETLEKRILVDEAKQSDFTVDTILGESENLTALVVFSAKDDSNSTRIAREIEQEYNSALVTVKAMSSSEFEKSHTVQ